MEKQLSFFDQAREKIVDQAQEKKTTKPVSQPVSKAPAANKKPRWQVFIDGASRGNPGLAGAGIYVVDHQTPIMQKGIFLGSKTNNQAEYLALLLALYFVVNYCTSKEIAIPHLHVISDSELLIKQLNGYYAVKNPVLHEFHKTALLIIKNIPHTFTHVLREHNKNADALANKGVDKRTKIPTDFSKFMSDYNPLVVPFL